MVSVLVTGQGYIQLGLNLMFEEGVKQNQVSQLLKLEQLFHSQYLTEELLNELISLYVRFVQGVHDSHALRSYFMEKIRFVLSRPEVIRILEKQTQNNRCTIRETVRGVMGVRAEEQAEIKRMAEEAKAEIRQNHLIHRKDQHKEDLREKERNMKIEMQLRIMQEVEENMTNLRKGIHQQQVQQQHHLKEIVNKQDQALDQRRANRKKKLRKKSADLTQKEDVAPPEPQMPIAREELKQVQKEVNQTFERFTRLTQNRLKLQNAAKDNVGRVKFQPQNQIYQEEELFDQDSKGKQAQKQVPVSFKKKPTPQPPKEKKVTAEPREGTNIGRVTVRKNQPEQFQEQEFL